ncbi:MAG: ribonuclease P protein component [Burkholderiaceae bacterium]
MTAIDPDSPLLGRLLRPADFVRVLATPRCLSSPHFAVHHLEGRPLPPNRPVKRDMKSVDVGTPVTGSLSTELSTGSVPLVGSGVDDSSGPEEVGQSGNVPGEPLTQPGVRRWLGLVVPKRHAKRAVTRTLMKRQIRNAAADCAAQLAPGLWVVRQRSPFDPSRFPSAASDALKQAARAELRALFERAARGERDRPKPRSPGAPARGGEPAKRAAAGSPPPAKPEGASCAA